MRNRTLIGLFGFFALVAWTMFVGMIAIPWIDENFAIRPQTLLSDVVFYTVIFSLVLPAAWWAQKTFLK